MRPVWPVDFHLGARCCAQSEVQAWVVAGQIAATGLALLHLAYSGGHNLYPRAEGVGVGFFPLTGFVASGGRYRRRCATVAAGLLLW